MQFLLRAAVALGLALFWVGQAQADDYPSRPVRVVVPFGPGGPADIYARLVGEHLAKALGQPFVIDNRPGAGAIIGTEEAARAAPDGYTLLMMSNTQTVNETLIARKKYQLLRDLIPVAPVNSSDLVMVVNPKVPAKSVGEFIALAKAKPGALNYASSGRGTPYHMAGELFKALTKTDIVHVPYKSSGEARTGVIGGQVEMMFDAVTTMMPNVQAGQVRALGTTGTERSPVAPGVPTIAEAGVPGYEATIWLGFMAPRGTPPEIVGKLNAEIGRYLGQPELRRAWEKQGATPLIMSPEAFGDYLRRDVEKWAKVITEAGIRPE